MKRKQVLALIMALAFTITSIPVNVHAQEVNNEAEATVVVGENEDTLEEVAERENEEIVQEVVEEQATQNESGVSTKESDSTKEVVATSEESNFTYELNEEKKGIVITGYEGEEEGDLVIPDEIDGYPVTEIGSKAFYDCDGFDGELVLPQSLKEIAKYAFGYCSGLSGDLVIPNGVQEIGIGAFDGCSGLNGKLVIPNSVKKIGNSAFYDCRALSGDLMIPDSVQEIGSSAFYNCEGFDGELVLPQSLKEIGKYAFGYCRGLGGNLVIPEGIQEIKKYTFYDCEGLEGHLIIPESVKRIEDEAFWGCAGLKSVTLPEGIEFIGDDAFRRYDEDDDNVRLSVHIYCSEGSYAYEWARKEGFKINDEKEDVPTEKSKFTYQLNQDGTGMIITGYSGDERGTLTIPSEINGYSVTEIGDYAFENFKSSGKLKLPDSIEKIGNYAFSGCEFLGKLTLPKSLIVIGEYAFANCGTFSNYYLTIPEGVTEILKAAFMNCKIQGNLYFKNELKTIGDYAFFGCNKLEETLSIPESVTSIGSYAFYGCEGFDKVYLRSNIESIGKGAFNMQNADGKVSGLPATFYGYEGTVAADWIKQENVNVIWWTKDEQYSYKYNESGITIVENIGKEEGDLVIPNEINGCAVTEIGDYAFEYADYDGKLVIPNSVKKIGDYAFYYCNELEGNLNLENVEEIGSYAFFRCPGFTGTPRFSSELTKIEAYAFYGCYGFDGILQLPSNLTEIGSYAFYYCEGFTGELVLPKSLKRIGKAAFRECSGFTGQLMIPNSVISVGSYAFYKDSGFDGELVVSEGVAEIESYAFMQCTGLDSINLPASLNSIGAFAFNNTVDELLAVKVKCSEDSYALEWAWNTGFTVNGKYNESLKEESKYYDNFEYKYKYDYAGEKIGIIIVGYKGATDKDVNIPDSIDGYPVVEIGDFAFTECGVFTGGLTLPKNLKKIGYSAFSDNNTGVYHGAFKGELVIPEGVIEIGDRAFMNTGFSGELVIPSSVKKIGDQAFSYCIKLAGLTLQEGLVSIGNSAFFAANALSGDLVIPDGVTKIGDQAFTYCTKLENVSLSDSVETIGNSAFHTEDDRGYMIPCNILMYCEENTYAYDWAIRNGFKVNVGKLESKYSITYNLDGGTNNETNPSFYKSSSEKIVLQNPTKLGYKFVGWYSDSNYKTKVTEIATGSTGNKILYAKWTENQYKIIFDGNGATNGKMNSIAAKYGTEYTLTTNAYNKTGYTFTGWNTKKDGSGTSYSYYPTLYNKLFSHISCRLKEVPA